MEARIPSLFVASSSCLNKREPSICLSGVGYGQASHITGGIYLKPPQPDGLFEYLMVHYIYSVVKNCVSYLYCLLLSSSSVGTL
jgi:hypothetical protein